MGSVRPVSVDLRTRTDSTQVETDVAVLLEETIPAALAASAD